MFLKLHKTAAPSPLTSSLNTANCCHATSNKISGRISLRVHLKLLLCICMFFVLNKDWTNASSDVEEVPWCLSQYPNLALRKPAWQSSIKHNKGIAKQAVDGNLDGNFRKGSCTLTLVEYGPWWVVDLQTESEIVRVSITNRAIQYGNLNDKTQNVSLDGSKISTRKSSCVNARGISPAAYSNCCPIPAGTRVLAEGGGTLVLAGGGGGGGSSGCELTNKLKLLPSSSFECGRL